MSSIPQDSSPDGIGPPGELTFTRPKMTIRTRILMIGAGAGALVAIATVLAVATLGPLVGVALALLAATAAGALAAQSGARLLGRRVVAHLANLHGEDPDRFGSPPSPLDWHAFDDEIDAIRRALADSRQLQGESEAVEWVARSFLVAVQGTSHSNGARVGFAGLLDNLHAIAAILVRDAGALEEVNERMASGAVDQSETVTRTTTTVEALSDKIDRISQHAEDAAKACEKSRQEACRGLEQVHSVIEGMDRLRAQVEVNGRKARRLGDRSIEIGTIVEMIRGISNRTDMLALNATIESVRAGEHGRGFAVVAEEIRKLAERTAAAAREIGTLVEAIQADTHESIRAMGEEQTQMEQEAQRVRETGTALERISEVAEYSARLAEEISRSSNDQVLATQELVRAMQRISEVSHRTLDGATLSRDLIRELAQSCVPFQGMLENHGIPESRDGSAPDRTTAASLPARLVNRRARSEQPA